MDPLDLSTGFDQGRTRTLEVGYGAGAVLMALGTDGGELTTIDDYRAAGGFSALEKARAIVERARDAVHAQDISSMREHVESLERAQRMFRGVTATS